MRQLRVLRNFGDFCVRLRHRDVQGLPEPPALAQARPDRRWKAARLQPAEGRTGSLGPRQ